MLMERTQDKEDPDPSAIITRQDFAGQLTLLRERAGLSVRNVADRINVPASTVGGYLSGRHLPPPKPAGPLADILRVCGVDDPDAVDQWMQALRRVRRNPGPRPASAPVPYRGLKAFQPQDAEWFYGREALTELLIECLAERQDGGLIAVVGASGAGKSSLLRAGLIPELSRGALPGSEGWPGIVFEPGRHPDAELETRLGAYRADWPAGNQRLVIVVDQFEETFVACTDENEQNSFIDALAALAEPGCGSSPAASVVLGLRADFYGTALRFPRLVDALQDAQVVVGPMTENELRRAIVEPARKANLDIEDGLVELLLRDLAPTRGGPTSPGAYDAGALPLLSHALLATFQRHPNSRLTVAAYRESGSIEGAIGHTADAVFGGLNGAQQEIARRLFAHLVHINEDAADTRRRVSHAELIETGIGDSSDGLEDVLSKFIAQRLITADEDTVQITHEALLFAWPRLRGWLDADRKGYIINRELTAATHDWHVSGCHDSGLLYRGVRLAEARDWVKSHGNDIGDRHRAFLKASVRTERRRGWNLAGVAILLIIALAASILAARQNLTSAAQRREAAGRELLRHAGDLRNTQPLQSLLFNVKAYQYRATVESRSALLDAQSRYYTAWLPSHTNLINAVALHPDGVTLAIAGQDHTIELWNLKTHARGAILRLESPVYSVAFSPTSPFLATADEHGSVQLWDLRTNRRLVTLLAGSGTSANSVAFSRNGEILASAHTDGLVRVWDMRTGGNPSLVTTLTNRSGPIEAVAISPDGHIMASATNAKVALWDVSSKQYLGSLSTSASVRALAFSVDGRTLATGLLAEGNSDAEVQLWDVTTRSQKGIPLKGHADSARGLAFNGDGSVLATGDDGGAVRLWDVGTGKLLSALVGPTGVVTGLVWDGRTLVSVGADSTVGLWNVPALNPPDTTTASAVAFGPAGSEAVATVGVDGSVALWSTARRNSHVSLSNSTQTRPGTSKGNSGARPVAAFNTTGDTLISDVAGEPIKLWNTTDGKLLGTITENSQEISAVALHPDGRVLASVGDDRTLTLWDLQTDQLISRQTPQHFPINDVAFSPDGTMIATGSDDRLVRLFKISSNQELDRSEFPEQVAPVEAVAFSPDGGILASAVAVTIPLWDSKEQQLIEILEGHARTVISVAFSPDQRTFASVDEGGVIKLWDIGDLYGKESRGSLRATLIATLSSEIGPTAIAFSPDGRTLAGADQNGTVLFWDIDPQQVISRICATLTDSAETAWLHSLPKDLPRTRICP